MNTGTVTKTSAKQQLAVIVDNDGATTVYDINKISAHSGDKFKIIKKVDGKDQNVNNFIAIKKGNDLEILFEDGQTVSLENFYSFNNVKIEFSASNGTEYILSSESSFGSEFADNNFLVYAQGDQNLLFGIAGDNSNLQAALNEQFMVINAERFAELETAAGAESSAVESEGMFGSLSTAAMVGLGAVIVGGVVVASNNSSSGTVLGSNGLIGQFIDSAIAGADYYINGVYAGKTGADGSFNYESGDTITFKVGNITIGDITAAEINADGKVLPQDLAGVARTDTTDATVVKIAQFLQTLDSDGDATNGITMDATSLAKVDGSGTVDLTTANLTDAIDDDVEAEIVTADDAILHLNDTTNSLDSTFVAATTLTGTISEIMQDITLGDGTDVEVTDTTLNIEQLMAIKAIIGDGVLTYPNMTTITGKAENLAADTTYVAAGINVTVTDAATIAQLTAIDGLSTGTMTYTEMTDTAANLAANTGGYLTGAINVIIAAGAVNAADIVVIDNSTTGTVDMISVTMITGTETDIGLVYAADPQNDINHTTDITVAGSTMSVANVNFYDADTTGVITATITEGDAATLTTLTNTNANNALTITVTDAAVAAADGLLLDTKTSLTIDATAATLITGTAAEMLAANAADIAIAADVDMTITDTVDASFIYGTDGTDGIDAVTTGVVTATITAGTVSGFTYDLNTLTVAPDGIAGTLDALTMTDAGNALNVTILPDSDFDMSIADILAIDARTTVQVDASTVTDFGGTAAEVLAFQAAKDAGTITYPDNSVWYSVIGDTTKAQLIDIADHTDTNALGIVSYVLDSGDALDVGWFATQDVYEVWSIDSETDTAANAITISLADLQTLPEQTLVDGLNGNIYINSGAEDSVTFDDISGWTVTQNVTFNSVVYDEYTQGGFTVHIQDGTTVA